MIEVIAVLCTAPILAVDLHENLFSSCQQQSFDQDKQGSICDSMTGVSGLNPMSATANIS